MDAFSSRRNINKRKKFQYRRNTNKILQPKQKQKTEVTRNSYTTINLVSSKLAINKNQTINQISKKYIYKKLILN